MAEILTAQGLVKTYRDVKAVAGVDLEIHAGECVALLGPNGAGKTTTVEMLEGLIKPDDGSIRIFGKTLSEANRPEIMNRIGVTLQDTQLYKKMTVKETVQLFRSFFKSGMSVDEAIKLVSLEEKQDTRLEKLSGGQKQRTYLACAVVNNPDLLFLDEPTTGLDPQARRSIWDLLTDLKNSGKSILLTTHYMDEAAYLADKVVVVDRGKVIAQGTAEALIKKYCGSQLLRFKIKDLPSTTGLKDELARTIHWAQDLKINGDFFELDSDEPAVLIADLNESIEKTKMSFEKVEIRSATLEDVFLTITGRSMRDDES